MQIITLTGLSRDLNLTSANDGTTFRLGSIHTFGNSLDVSSDGDLNVLTDAVISTRSLSTGNDETGASNASSGSITLSTNQSIDVRGQLPMPEQRSMGGTTIAAKPCLLFVVS